jgi:hypothetical protein
VQRPGCELKMLGVGLELVIGGALREVEEGAEAAVAAGTTRWKLEMRGTSHETVRVEAIMQAINWAARAKGKEKGRRVMSDAVAVVSWRFCGQWEEGAVSIPMFIYRSYISRRLDVT